MALFDPWAGRVAGTMETAARDALAGSSHADDLVGRHLVMVARHLDVADEKMDTGAVTRLSRQLTAAMDAAGLLPPKEPRPHGGGRPVLGIHGPEKMDDGDDDTPAGPAVTVEGLLGGP